MKVMTSCMSISKFRLLPYGDVPIYAGQAKIIESILNMHTFASSCPSESTMRQDCRLFKHHCLSSQERR
jgi:alanine-alpha-ketoisovalerate/valine-pyruvate aminotransferase